MSSAPTKYHIYLLYIFYEKVHDCRLHWNWTISDYCWAYARANLRATSNAIIILSHYS